MSRPRAIRNVQATSAALWSSQHVPTHLQDHPAYRPELVRCGLDVGTGNRSRESAVSARSGCQHASAGSRPAQQFSRRHDHADGITHALLMVYTAP